MATGSHEGREKWWRTGEMIRLEAGKNKTDADIYSVFF